MKKHIMFKKLMNREKIGPLKEKDWMESLLKQTKKNKMNLIDKLINWS